MLNNEQVTQQEVSQDETSLDNSNVDLEKSHSEEIGQLNAVDNESNSTIEESTNTVPWEVKQQHWRKKEKKLEAENKRLVNEKSQYENIFRQFFQPQSEVPNTSVETGVSQPAANKTFEQQMAEFQKKQAAQIAEQEHIETLVAFKSKLDEMREQNPLLDEAANKLGHHVSERMFSTLAYHAEDFNCHELLAHLLINDPVELQRINSLSPAKQTRELTEKIHDFRSSRLAKKSNAPPPAKQGVKNQSPPQVVDPNKLDVRGWKDLIRAREEARRRWQHQMKS